MALNVGLWIVQVLLAALFLFAGGMKLVLPIDAMQGPVYLPGWFLRFIGIAEVLGALGLVLPGLFRIRRELTPLAAVGLVIIMAGATVVTLMGGVILPALVPFTVGLLLAFVVRGRGQSLRLSIASRGTPAAATSQAAPIWKTARLKLRSTLR